MVLAAIVVVVEILLDNSSASAAAQNRSIAVWFLNFPDDVGGLHQHWLLLSTCLACFGTMLQQVMSDKSAHGTTSVAQLTSISS